MSLDKKRICFFYVDVTMSGGIERVLSLITSELADNWNYEVTIVSIFKSNPKPLYSFSPNVKFVYLINERYPDGPGSFKRLALLLKSYKAIKKFFKHHIFDIISAQAFPVAFIAYISGIPRNKLIAVEHVYYGYYKEKINSIRIPIYKRLGSVVTLTNKDKELFEKDIKHVVTIPNPVVFSEGEPSLLESKTIIAVGRLEYQKGFDTLIEAFKTIHSKYPDWKLNIWGKGTLEESLKQQIQNKGLLNAVALCGVTDNVSLEFQKSAFYVMSSRFEGFPMVLTEAMREGVPPISFRCPNGPDEIISDMEDGLLVNNQDIDHLIEAMEYMITHPNKRKEMGAKAFTSIRRFDVKEVAAQWNKLFLKIIALSEKHNLSICDSTVL